MSCTPMSLTGIALDCGNVGGLSVVYITDIANVASVAIVDGEVTGITMVSGATFKTFNFRKGNANWVSTGARDDAAGTSSNSTVVELKFNKMETAKRKDLEALAKGNSYVIAKDNNGLYWLIGYSTTNSYAAGSLTANTGANLADPNQYTLTLTAECPESPIQIATAFNVSTIVS